MTADEFTALRTASGWTRAELAGLMECSPQAVGRWERGTRRISPGVALQVRTVPKKPPGNLRKKRVAKR